jgi:hypothetical protein
MVRAYDKAALECCGGEVVTIFEPKAAACDGDLGLQL